MRIGIDVDSGERPFEELVQGALDALCRLPDISIYLIGQSARIKDAFPDIEQDGRVFLVNADEIIGMDETPTVALKKKRCCTVAVGCRMLKNHSIDSFFSAGNTGATVVAGVLTLGMIRGIKKPAMATSFPRMNGGETILLDIGANPESSEENLYNNAILGQAYYGMLWNKSEPTIGLLNVGSELDKGSRNLKKAFTYLSKIPTFIGNVEGYNVLNGTVDVVVCDGFIGNTILKFAEAMKDSFIYILGNIFNTNKLSVGQKIVSSYLKWIKADNDPKKDILTRMSPKYFGAAPLLGVNGSILIGHGMSKAKDVANAVEFAYFLKNNNYVSYMTEFVLKNLKK